MAEEQTLAGAPRPTMYVGFSKGKGLANAVLGDAIRAFTGGTVNHAFIMYEHPVVGWITIGANNDGIQYLDLGLFLQSREIVKVFRPVTFSLWDCLDELRDDIGRKYNYAGLIGMSIVEIAHHWFNDYKIKNPGSVKATRFCSQWVADLFRQKITFLPSLSDDVIDPELEMETVARNTVDFALGAIPVSA